jgi:hypothetical protein
MAFKKNCIFMVGVPKRNDLLKKDYEGKIS